MDNMDNKEKMILLDLIKNSDKKSIDIYHLAKEQLKILLCYDSVTYGEQNKNENENENKN